MQKFRNKNNAKILRLKLCKDFVKKCENFTKKKEIMQKKRKFREKYRIFKTNAKFKHLFK